MEQEEIWGNHRTTMMHYSLPICHTHNITLLRYADDTTLMAESEEELKSLLVKVKEESEKIDLMLNTQKTKIMDPVPLLHGK